MCQNEHLLSKGLTLYHTIPSFNDCEKSAFCKSSGKKENAGKQHFLPFPQCFLHFKRQISYFYPRPIRHWQNMSIWTSLNFVIW